MRLLQLFAVGAFAGAIASFFPRLVALLGGDPTKEVQLFSYTYLIVGIAVAAVVGLVIVILESDLERKCRDVFMTALGVPTVLMGALSASATSSNVEHLQRNLQIVSDDLAARAGIVIRPLEPAASGTAPGSRLSPVTLLFPSAFAQAATAALMGQQNVLGIAARQSTYNLVLDAAATREALEPTRQKIAQRGIDSKVVPNVKGGWLLVPAANRSMPHSEAVREAIRVNELGAKAFLTPASN